MKAPGCAVWMEPQLALLLFKSERFTIGERWKHTAMAFAVFSSTQDILRREIEGCSFDDSCGRLIGGVDM